MSTGTNPNYVANQPPSYNNAPPTYADANAPPMYNNPPGYAQPPTMSSYTAPPPAQPNYAAPPTQNYNAPPPAHNYAAPPGPSYANAPTYANAPPTQPSYAGPPPTQTNYAAPPPTQPNYTHPHGHVTTVTTTSYNSVPESYAIPVANGQKRNFTFQLCSCFENFRWCCYVTWCHMCAVADLRTAVDGKPFTWWITVCVLVVLYFISYIPSARYLILLYNFVACAFVMWVGQQMRARLGIVPEDQCYDCLVSYFCLYCRVCQLGRELEMHQQYPEVKELVLNLQNANPCSNACMNDYRVQ